MRTENDFTMMEVSEEEWAEVLCRIYEEAEYGRRVLREDAIEHELEMIGAWG